MLQNIIERNTKQNADARTSPTNKEEWVAAIVWSTVHFDHLPSLLLPLGAAKSLNWTLTGTIRPACTEDVLVCTWYRQVYVLDTDKYILVCTWCEQTDTLWKERSLRLHHAGITHVVEMVNKFASEDKHLLCTDGQVWMCMYSVCSSTY